jgi:hypothetical protein
MGLIDYLKKEIKKSGYPLEIEISSMLDKRWDEVINTDSYYDSDEGKTRDIDINAYRIFDFLNGSLVFTANLTIECKKSESSAWVFFTRPFKYNFTSISGQYIDGLQVLTKNLDSSINMELILSSSKLHYSRLRKVAACFAEFPFQGKKSESYGKKEIFEAMTQLKKYITYTNEKILKTNIPVTIDVYFPCIVFDGQIFEAQIKGEMLRLKRTEHILLTTSQPSPYSIWDLRFMIDVVSKSYFQNFLSEIDDSIKSIQQVIKRKAKKILASIANMEESLRTSKINP